MVKSIFLQDGEEIFVDDEDYERVNEFKWYKDFFMNSRSIRTGNRKNRIKLNSFIKSGSYQIVKNNDFTKNNLTTKGNKTRWTGANYNSSSKYKGVSWHKRDKKWCVGIRIGGELKFLGSFKREDDAAKVYNQAVLEYWDGEGYLNIIGEDNRTLKRNYITKPDQRITRKVKKNLKGVTENKNRYVSRKTFKGRRLYLGSFDSQQKAALVYNKCAIYLHDEDVILNDVPMTDELKEFISNWEIPERIKLIKEDY
ncbi:AP2/ERF family transcription factor [Mammaliicoccus lentus]|uniref:AP2 domain-containing protein n=1 Tax=Mammaliicoccus lentus TaxID=42858 RepID=UPI002DBEFCFB|nr:AP2 domain-containing protein [Mammaliicoccus lentus]MEB8091882.1 AP2 domain-containing protein [Mammaliicoccus lentus]